MKQKKEIHAAYNKSSESYADQFMNELDGKSLDRLLLKRFADDNQAKGTILDLACGPGQTTLFLHRCGADSLLGIDLSEGMIEVAKKLHPEEIKFQVADILQLPFADQQFSSAISFYGIVHFTYSELAKALLEIYRVLKPGGQFLFSFHVGNGTNSLEEFLGHAVKMDFYYFEVEKVLSLLKESGWKQLEVVERYPYKDVEYPSRRAYILVEKSKSD